MVLSGLENRRGDSGDRKAMRLEPMTPDLYVQQLALVYFTDRRLQGALAGAIGTQT